MAMASATGFVGIVTGPPGVGKTTLAAALAAAKGVECISADAFRFSPGTWMKVPAEDFARAVFAAVEKAVQATGGYVFESAYFDAHDPSDARGVVIRELCTSRHWPTPKLFLLRGSLQQSLTGIVDRSMRRFADARMRELGLTDGGSTVPQGAALETAASVVQLLMKVMTNYDAITAALDALAVVAGDVVAGTGSLSELQALTGVALPFVPPPTAK